MSRQKMVWIRFYHIYKAGHQKWGFAIFRCTYGNGEA
jgi:hypothetical protein